jgi:hypothetical protein
VPWSLCQSCTGHRQPKVTSTSTSNISRRAVRWIGLVSHDQISVGSFLATTKRNYEEEALNDFMLQVFVAGAGGNEGLQVGFLIKVLFSSYIATGLVIYKVHHGFTVANGINGTNISAGWIYTHGQPDVVIQIAPAVWF